MIYTNTRGAHNKFWGYTCRQVGNSDWLVTTYWGRIGVQLEYCPRKEFNFYSEWEAQEFIQKKLDEKRNKGYRPLNKTYSELLSDGDEESNSGSFEIDLKDLEKNIDVY